MSIVAVNLVALGFVLLTFSGMVFAIPGQLLNFAGMHIETAESRFIAPVVGALMVLLGVVWLTVNRKRAS